MSFEIARDAALQCAAIQDMLHVWVLIVVSATSPRFPSGRKPRAAPLGAPTSVGTWGRGTSVRRDRAHPVSQFDTDTDTD
jgi:hypothetical protein